ncbi:MAG TPA: hypothetical protein VFR94_05065, partial [Nitrososphaeraceae archaeon]|nr:hypothetical protein [Nitrososphaeraceae archaeon]
MLSHSMFVLSTNYGTVGFYDTLNSVDSTRRSVYCSEVAATTTMNVPGSAFLSMVQEYEKFPFPSVFP